MDSLSVYFNNNLFELQYSNSSFDRWIRGKLKNPKFKRAIEMKEGCVIIKPSFLPEIIANWPKFFDKVNTSTLPPHYAELFGPKQNTINIGENPYEQLFLLKDAPMEVVKASYKALSQLHHPDRGGSGDEFSKITDAYKRIRNSREGRRDPHSS